MSGLALGRELVRRGCECTVLEAEGRPGGIVSSERAGGLILENGPQRARLTAPFAALVGELGSERISHPGAPGPRFLHLPGRQAPPCAPLRAPFSGIRCRELAREASRDARAPDIRASRRRTGGFVLLSQAWARAVRACRRSPLRRSLRNRSRDMVVELSLGGLLRDLGIGRSLLFRAFAAAARAPAHLLLRGRDGKPAPRTCRSPRRPGAPERSSARDRTTPGRLVGRARRRDAAGGAGGCSRSRLRWQPGC